VTNRTIVTFLTLTLTLGLAGCGGGDEAKLTPEVALDRLSLDAATAEELARETLVSGQAWRAIAAVGGHFKVRDDDDREAIVRAMGPWLRRYVESDSFARAYAAQRQSLRPEEETFRESIEDALERWRSEGLAQVEETRASVLPLLPESDREGFVESLDAMKAQYLDPEMYALQRRSLEMTREQARRSFESALADWTERYPESPAALVKQRLETFLATCDDVDFGAELKEQYGKLRFVDPALERRSTEWKWCFRAGRASVDAAREFASKWLAELR
jgi:hypothetical protein